MKTSFGSGAVVVKMVKKRLKRRKKREIYVRVYIKGRNSFFTNSRILFQIDVKSVLCGCDKSLDKREIELILSTPKKLCVKPTGCVSPHWKYAGVIAEIPPV